MNVRITQESFDTLNGYWKAGGPLRWQPVFVLPAWLKTWWSNFGSGFELYLGVARSADSIIGIAPMLLHDKTASIMGGRDVCDYLDFIVAPGSEADFFAALLADLKSLGIAQLDLGPLRPDSVAYTQFLPMLKAQQYPVSCQEEDVSVEMSLPASWDAYFESLDTKERHELRRKLRKLFAAGKISYRWLKTQGEINASMDTFLKLFALSQEEKAGFMTSGMESFFRSLAASLSEVGLMRLGVLELDAVPLAMVVGFDYGDAFYLYNSACDPRYNYLSAGLLSKALCIKESIEQGKQRYDFLKGNEGYKYHLGGKAITLYRCQATMV